MASDFGEIGDNDSSLLRAHSLGELSDAHLQTQESPSTLMSEGLLKFGAMLEDGY